MSGGTAPRWAVLALVVLTLAGCAQSTAGQVGGTHPPAAPADTGARPEHGGGNGGGGGSM